MAVQELMFVAPSTEFLDPLTDSKSSLFSGTRRSGVEVREISAMVDLLWEEPSFAESIQHHPGPMESVPHPDVDPGFVQQEAWRQVQCGGEKDSTWRAVIQGDCYVT